MVQKVFCPQYFFDLLFIIEKINYLPKIALWVAIFQKSHFRT